jgi:hypothetical protein
MTKMAFLAGGDRRRLQDKFGSRWRTKMVVQANPNENGSKPATPTTDQEQTDDRETPVRPHRAKRKRPKRIQVIRFKAIDGGSGEGVEREVASGIGTVLITAVSSLKSPDSECEHAAIRY